MAFRNTRVSVGLIDQTINSVDYVMQDSAGAFQIYMDTCQKTGVTLDQKIAQQLANEKADADSLDLVANSGPLFSKFIFIRHL